MSPRPEVILLKLGWGLSGTSASALTFASASVSGKNDIFVSGFLLEEAMSFLLVAFVSWTLLDPTCPWSFNAACV